MNRKVWLLNLALIALAGTLVWQLRAHWRAAVSHQSEVLANTPPPKPVLPPPAPPPVKTATPGEYLDVAQRTLFSRDRNPNPIEEPAPAPPPAPPPKPVPPLPVYRGQMAIGEPVVILSLQGPDQKSYHTGDEVGPFKLVAFDRESITLEFDGKTIERKVAELQPKDAPPPAPTASAPAPAAAVRSLTAPGGQPPPPALGPDMGGDFKACVPNDSSPSGTVLNGFRKVITRSLMGQACRWEPVK